MGRTSIRVRVDAYARRGRGTVEEKVRVGVVRRPQALAGLADWHVVRGATLRRVRAARSRLLPRTTGGEFTYVAVDDERRPRAVAAEPS